MATGKAARCCIVCHCLSFVISLVLAVFVFPDFHILLLFINLLTTRTVMTVFTCYLLYVQFVGSLLVFMYMHTGCFTCDPFGNSSRCVEQSLPVLAWGVFITLVITEVNSST